MDNLPDFIRQLIDEYTDKRLSIKYRYQFHEEPDDWGRFWYITSTISVWHHGSCYYNLINQIEPGLLIIYQKDDRFWRNCVYWCKSKYET